jgi:hypothetical protein
MSLLHMTFSWLLRRMKNILQKIKYILHYLLITNINVITNKENNSRSRRHFSDNKKI